MMRFIAVIISFLVLLPLVAQAQDYQIYSTKAGKNIPLTTMVRELKKYDVIFFGEYHDNRILHDLQQKTLGLLYNQNPRLILSFEMFERDVQNVIDDYLKDRITEATFLAASRPWGNYDTDYRPLLEFAKEKKLPVVAANIPRRLAGQAARGGNAFLSELEPAERILAALQISAPEGRYRDNFMATMLANSAHGAGENADLYERMYYAQCMKDDTMAESIVQYREKYPKHRVLHINGDFHSREFLGTVERVISRNKKLKIAVISPMFNTDKIPYQAHKVANYIIIIPPQDK